MSGTSCSNCCSFSPSLVSLVIRVKSWASTSCAGCVAEALRGSVNGDHVGRRAKEICLGENMFLFEKSVHLCRAGIQERNMEQLKHQAGLPSP